MKVVVAGALANKPAYGGEAWVRLAWVRGLRALGVDAVFVERLGRGASGPSGPPGYRESQVRFFESVVDRFGLSEVAALIGPGGERLAGLGPEEVMELGFGADLLVNLSGHLPPGDPAFDSAHRRAYVDLDPGFTQFWYATGVGDLALDRHDVLFTVGWNVGTGRCEIPTCGLDWIPIRQPVMLDAWPARELPPDPLFTTIASWRGSYGPVSFRGRTYGVKAHEFRKYMDLPSRVGIPLELALDIHPGDGDDRDKLTSAGWRLVDPRRVAATPEAYRDYVAASSGELSVAQAVYVETESGWFSDRSARYLASGRAVVIQDTGLAPGLPVGEGILAFRTPEEAAASVRAAVRDPEMHARTARSLAEEHFDARRVLPQVLDRALGERVWNGSRVSRATANRHPTVGDTLLVSGMIAAVPGQGGASWAALQYVLGLLRLGYDVHFVEELPVGSNGSHDPARTDSWSYLTALARRFGLEGRMSLVTRGTRCTAGREYGELRALARRCRLLVNLSGTLSDPEILESIPIRLYVDLDPAFTQLWQGEGIDVGLRWHTHFATVGLALGTRSCGIPTCGVDWIPTLPPVCLDEWPEVPTPPTRDAWTTVSHWRGYGSVEWNGCRHGQKAHAFRPLFPLPARSGDRFEVALAIHPRESDDLVALDAHGWTLIDPSKVAGDPDRYRGFVSGSAGEIGVAKEGYVASSSGWFSDRSACYLASGRPVVAQETGFSSYLPTGRGLLAFETLDEAAACVLEARGNYDAHARGARALAEEHLDARVVLKRLLDEIGR